MLPEPPAPEPTPMAAARIATPSPEPAEPQPLRIVTQSDGSLRVNGVFEIRSAGRKFFVVASEDGRDLIKAWLASQEAALDWVAREIDSPSYAHSRFL